MENVESNDIEKFLSSKFRQFVFHVGEQIRLRLSQYIYQRNILSRIDNQISASHFPQGNDY